MPTAKFVQPDYTTQSGTGYPLGLDAMASVFKRFGAAFAPRAQDTPNMTVAVDAGMVFDGVTLTEVAAQNSATITAPSTNPRIDRIVISNLTGTVSVVTGTQAASPVPPAIPFGKLPIARVLLQTSSTVITNSMITDERPRLPGSVGLGGGSLSGGLNMSRSTVTQNASTMDLWAPGVGNIIDGGGSAVTITDFINTNCQAGAIRFFYPITGTILTHGGGKFDVDGGFSPTAEAGDLWIIIPFPGGATWQVSIIKHLGTPINMSSIIASLGSDVALNNTANYFDGPSIAQGTVGQWLVFGTVSLSAGGNDRIFAKLWDGTTVLDSAGHTVFDTAAAIDGSISLIGVITSPAGNLRISCKDITGTTGKIVFNGSGNSKDSTITAIRIR